MERTLKSEALAALADLLSEWRSRDYGPDVSSHSIDVRQLERLLSDTEMEGVWNSLSRNSRTHFGGLAAKLLLVELFERAARLPAWQSETAKSRRKRLDLIAQTSEKLRNLLAESPLQHFSADALERMHLDPRLVDADSGIFSAADSDFDEALKDLQEQAQSWRDVNPLLRYPAREDAHKRYFVISINDYLERNFCPGLNRELAVLARIMLRDPTIDTEVVRKIIGPSGKPRGRPRKR